VAVDQEIGSGYRVAGFSKRPCDTGHVASPTGNRGIGLNRRPRLLEGVQPQHAISSPAGRHEDPLRDGHRQDEPVVVVGVLPDEIDAAWGGPDAVRLAAVALLELGVEVAQPMTVLW
jgi:hypothetical protein